MRASIPLLLLAAGTAQADPTPVATTVEPPPRTEPALVKPAPTPAPAPEDASGVVVEDERSTGDRLRWIPRTLLFIPRTVYWVAMQPIRGAAYASERWDIVGRATDALFTDDRTFGLYPVAGYESGFGFTVGARMQFKDVFGVDERFKLRGDWGGRFKQAAGINIRSGHLFGRTFSVELDSSFERRPREKFYGIGDGDEIDVIPAMPIDPTLDDTAIKSNFQEDIVRNTVELKAKLPANFKSKTSGALMFRDFGSTDKNDIMMRYDTSKLVGFEDGVKNVYVEQEFAYDSRRPASEYQTETIDGAGWFVAAHVGATRGIEDDPSHFYRYGGEVQKYIDLYEGSRVLTLRVMYDAVAGTNGRTDGKISFVDLPRLGGSDYLRGYPTDRFRDRAVVLGSADYTWAIGNNFSAYTFVDVGRAMNAFEDIQDAEDLRAGFGGGIQVHTKRSFFTRAQIAASRDGDLFFKLVFSPAFDHRERAGQF